MHIYHFGKESGAVKACDCRREDIEMAVKVVGFM